MTQRCAFITGASAGLGSELARQLTARGYHLALVARRLELLEELACELRAKGASVAVFAADVTIWEEVERAYAAAEAELGAIDLVIANAGVAIDTPARRFDVRKAREVYEVNVIGAMHTIAAALPSMLARKSGHIVGISSLAAYFSVPRSYVYCASKSALSAHLQGLRLELARSGIKVSTVCPGFIRTPMTAQNPFKMPLLMDAPAAVAVILKRLEKGEEIINFPRRLYLGVRLLHMFPNVLQKKLLRGGKAGR